MRNQSKLIASLIIMGLATSVFAENLEIDGTIESFVTTPSLPGAPLNIKPIVFERIILSPEAKAYLALNLPDAAELNPSKLPAKAYVGMNNVPVLDQGKHGTCVTFAVTGALDAATTQLKKQPGSDLYSQLCSLELGSTLENASPYNYKSKNYAYPSGWNGSFGTIVLKQIHQYGLITTKYQIEKGCAGVRDYPLTVQEDQGKPMSIKDYVGNSERVFPQVSYNVILNVKDAFSRRYNPVKVLNDVKTALSKGHRVIFGTLVDVKVGKNGAAGTNKVENDTWILTPEIEQHIRAGEINAGHEMIIIGYDDNAEVNGHKGVLTLRNSWGNTGDHGNYYMTYDHFKRLTDEVIEFIPNKVS